VAQDSLNFKKGLSLLSSFQKERFSAALIFCTFSRILPLLILLYGTKFKEKQLKPAVSAFFIQPERPFLLKFVLCRPAAAVTTQSPSQISFEHPQLFHTFFFLPAYLPDRAAPRFPIFYQI